MDKTWIYWQYVYWRTHKWCEKGGNTTRWMDSTRIWIWIECFDGWQLHCGCSTEGVGFDKVLCQRAETRNIWQVFSHITCGDSRYSITVLWRSRGALSNINQGCQCSADPRISEFLLHPMVRFIASHGPWDAIKLGNPPVVVRVKKNSEFFSFLCWHPWLKAVFCINNVTKFQKDFNNLIT